MTDAAIFSIVVLGFLWIYFMFSDYNNFSKMTDLEEENRKLKQEIEKLKK